MGICLAVLGKTSVDSLLLDFLLEYLGDNSSSPTALRRQVVMPTDQDKGHCSRQTQSVKVTLGPLLTDRPLGAALLMASPTTAC